MRYSVVTYTILVVFVSGTEEVLISVRCSRDKHNKYTYCHF